MVYDTMYMIQGIQINRTKNNGNKKGKRRKTIKGQRRKLITI